MLMESLGKSLVAEFIGTFVLVFIGCSAVAYGTSTADGGYLGASLAFGLILIAITYILAQYSGAHVNPAVSFGAAVSGQFGWGKMILYWIAQLIAAIAAAALVLWFFGKASGVGASVGSLTYSMPWKAALVEAVITFILTLSVLYIAKNPANSVVGAVTIGVTLLAIMLAAYPLTGASTNPARSLGPAIFSDNLGSYWIYVIGPLVGALVAAIVYRLYNHDWKSMSCIKDTVIQKGIYEEQCHKKVEPQCHKKVEPQCGKEYKVEQTFVLPEVRQYKC